VIAMKNRFTYSVGLAFSDAGTQEAVTEESRHRIRIRLLLWTLGWSLLTYAAMLLYWLAVIPLAGLIAANVLFYIRSYLRMHDLCHAYSTKNWVVRFLPNALFANPVWGGVEPFITTHNQHHKYLGTDQDPWLPFYEGHPLRALFFNMLEPEVNLTNFIRQKGVSRALATNLAFDLARHGTNLFFFQGAYLTHMIVQRLCHGTGVFLFNYPMHRETFSRTAPLGSWNREREILPFAPFLQIFFGKALVDAAMYHNRHHIVGNILVPSHRYAMLSDEGPYTRYTHTWPLAQVQHVPSGPMGQLE
jgi:fatty acid desaturase